MTLRIWFVLKVPKKSAPSLVEPSPQPEQNAAPVGAIWGVYHRLGRIGLGPSWFVFFGGAGGVEQVPDAPHP